MAAIVARILAIWRIVVPFAPVNLSPAAVAAAGLAEDVEQSPAAATEPAILQAAFMALAAIAA